MDCLLTCVLFTRPIEYKNIFIHPTHSFHTASAGPLTYTSSNIEKLTQLCSAEAQKVKKKTHQHTLAHPLFSLTLCSLSGPWLFVPFDLSKCSFASPMDLSFLMCQNLKSEKSVATLHSPSQSLSDFLGRNGRARVPLKPHGELETDFGRRSRGHRVGFEYLHLT